MSILYLAWRYDHIVGYFPARIPGDVCITERTAECLPHRNTLIHARDDQQLLICGMASTHSTVLVDE